MSHLEPLIQDLGLILIAAAAMTLLFRWLKQPVVLGYLIAGFIVSKYFPSPWLSQYLPDFIPNMLQVHDEHSIEIWSEIGVIFMLFGLGLEFSFKKLIANGRVAAITGGFEVVSTTILGFLVGKLFGWGFMDSIFFGAMLAMSSTTIIVKVFEDLKLKRKPFALIVFGGLIVEDLLAILLLVLLSSIAISQQFAGMELLFSFFKLVFFMLLWFVMGIYLLPWFTQRFRKLLSDEILLLVSVGLCFLMVIIACKVGFSSALGAFVMGSILAETSKGTTIEHLTQPVKNLFSAVFFVSVGMMIDPAILWEYAGTILAIIGITVVAKFFGTGVGALLAGCKYRDAMRAGLSMAQIGEFSFIIATLGVTLGVISPFLYPVAVAVSAVTTLTTPYLILNSETVINWMDKVIPQRVRQALNRYEAAVNKPTGGKKNIFLLLWRIHGVAIMLNCVLVAGIALGMKYLLPQLLPDASFVHHLPGGEIGLCFLTTLLAAPFLWGVFRRPPSHPDIDKTETFDQLIQSQFGVPVQRIPQDARSGKTLDRLIRLNFGVSVVRIITGCALTGFLVGIHLPLLSLAGLLVWGATILFFLICGRVFESLYYRFESRFVFNLSEKEFAVVEERSRLAHFAPWEATLTEFTLSEYSPIVMKKLMDSNLKRDFGVTVAIIRRADQNIIAPQSHEVLLPRDKLYLIGTYEQLSTAKDVIELHPEEEAEFNEGEFGMIPVRLTAEHSFVGKSIRDCGLRESVNGLIVGLEREDEHFLNPEPAMVLQCDDVIWLVGDKNRMKEL